MTRSIMKLRLIGNCVAVTIPKDILVAAGWYPGDRILMTAESGNPTVSLQKDDSCQKKA